jgi:hypothetical protein
MSSTSNEFKSINNEGISLRSFIAAVAFLVLTCTAPAEEKSASEPLHMLQAISASGKITLDGILNEETWTRAVPATDFIQRDPDEGRESTERTELRVAFDGSAVYFGVRLFDGEPGKIVSRLSRRDEYADSDMFTIQLSPYHDGLTGALFQISAAGVQRDAVISNDVYTDYSWEGVWESAVGMDAQGWCAEIRIPFSQLRFPASENHLWGINASRFIHRKNESVWLHPVKKTDNGTASRMDDLGGINGIEASRNLELLPYVAARSEFIKPMSSGDPFNDGSRQFASTGIDIKYGLSSNFTLDATINPDFGQVEVDPAVVNLTAFETYFPEKRPFFLEGANIFDNFGRIGSNNFWGFNRSEPDLFYSRRIGRFPQGSPTGDFVDMPAGTTILGAGKITGKTRNGWTFGLIEAVTAREFADVLQNDIQSTEEVEPLTNYFIGRVLREKDRSGIGILATGVQRELSEPALNDMLPEQAYAAGMDAYYYLDAKKNWVVHGRLAGSWLTGSPTAINRLEQSPQHYFQRPDAPHVSLHPDATSMKGWTGSINLNRQSGNVTVNSALWATSPGFESNDLGFQTGGDAAGTHVAIFWKKPNPDRWTRSRYLWAAKWWSWNFANQLTGNGLSMEAGLTTKNYWNFWAYTSQNWRAKRDRMTRGGPLAAKAAYSFIDLGGRSDSRKPVSFGVDVGYGWSDEGGWEEAGGLSLSLKPSSFLTITTGPSISRSRGIAQYVNTVVDSTAAHTYGSRYVFSDIDQFQVSMSTRINWILSPKMSLQVYMQPLVSVGDYWDYKEFAKPGTLSFWRYGVETGTISLGEDRMYTVDPDAGGAAPSFSFYDPDFNFKSLRVNAIFRWEWRLGSTFYLVWTQNRQDYSNPGQFSPAHDIAKMFTAPSNNILMARIAYWLSR